MSSPRISEENAKNLPEDFFDDDHSVDSCDDSEQNNIESHGDAAPFSFPILTFPKALANLQIRNANNEIIDNLARVEEIARQRKQSTLAFLEEARDIMIERIDTIKVTALFVVKKEIQMQIVVNSYEYIEKWMTSNQNNKEKNSSSTHLASLQKNLPVLNQNQPTLQQTTQTEDSARIQRFFSQLNINCNSLTELKKIAKEKNKTCLMFIDETYRELINNIKKEERAIDEIKSRQQLAFRECYFLQECIAKDNVRTSPPWHNPPEFWKNILFNQSVVKIADDQIISVNFFFNDKKYAKTCQLFFYNRLNSKNNADRYKNILSVTVSGEKAIIRFKKDTMPAATIYGAASYFEEIFQSNYWDNSLLETQEEKKFVAWKHIDFLSDLRKSRIEGLTLRLVFSEDVTKEEIRSLYDHLKNRIIFESISKERTESNVINIIFQKKTDKKYINTLEKAVCYIEEKLNINFWKYKFATINQTVHEQKDSSGNDKEDDEAISAEEHRIKKKKVKRPKSISAAFVTLHITCQSLEELRLIAINNLHTRITFLDAQCQKLFRELNSDALEKENILTCALFLQKIITKENIERNRENKISNKALNNVWRGINFKHCAVTIEKDEARVLLAFSPVKSVAKLKNQFLNKIRAKTVAVTTLGLKKVNSLKNKLEFYFDANKMKSVTIYGIVSQLEKLFKIHYFDEDWNKEPLLTNQMKAPRSKATRVTVDSNNQSEAEEESLEDKKKLVSRKRHYDDSDEQDQQESNSVESNSVEQQSDTEESSEEEIQLNLKKRKREGSDEREQQKNTERKKQRRSEDDIFSARQKNQSNSPLKEWSVFGTRYPKRTSKTQQQEMQKIPRKSQ